MNFPVRVPLLSGLLLPAAMAWGSGSGLNVIVVVNQKSTNSVQLGNEYCEKRGVPPQNVFRMTNWTGGSITWSRTDFETRLRDPLLAMITSRGLTNQIDFVLLSMDIPYRVMEGESQNSTTSALFYGFKTNSAPPPGLPATCSLPDSSSNSYAYTELPFHLGRPNTAPTNSFLAMMLTDTDLGAAQSILARGVASDSSFPTQTVYLEKTTDMARNVRFMEFDNAMFDTRVRSNYALVRVDGNSTSATNSFGLLTGLSSLSLPSNAFVPGAIADNLTSFGGWILENSGQTPLLAFLHAGAAGSYGTVVEPCNYTQKFPDALVYLYQNRGFSLAEAYYLSLLNPYQGLLVGEPLSAPFARVGGAEWSSLTNGSTLTGARALTPTFYAAGPRLPVGQVDLFIDGAFYTTMTNAGPSPGNLLSVTLNESTVSYTVPANAALPSITAGLAAAMNSQSGLTRVQAYAYSDRLELHSLSPTIPGTNVLLSATSAAGTAPQLTTFLTPARPSFLDSIAKGRLWVLIQNAPAVGDWLRLDFAKTNGSHVIIAVTNTVAGTTIGSLTRSLVNQVNANAGLQGADGAIASDFYDYSPMPAAEFTIYARSAGWPAAQLRLTLTSSPNLSTFPAGSRALEDNLTDLRPRDHLDISAGASVLPVQFTLDTTRLPDGSHTLAAVAYEGTSIRTQTRISRTVRVQNTSLAASFVPLVTVTNVTLDTPLQFGVTANTPSISRIELFSTGGVVAAATNQSSVVLSAPTSILGVGLHPFYALVTGTTGNRYRTETVWLRLVPSFNLAMTRNPLTVSWAAIPGQRYDLLRTTNLAVPFQVAASILASNSVVQWPVPLPSPAPAFYRVRLAP